MFLGHSSRERPKHLWQAGGFCAGSSVPDLPAPCKNLCGAGAGELPGGKEPCGGQEHFRPAAPTVLAQSGARLFTEMLI